MKPWRWLLIDGLIIVAFAAAVVCYIHLVTTL